jgi:hypothetical protein
MRLKARDLIFVALVVVSVGGLYLLSTRAKVPPAMPASRPHLDAKTREQCLSCHPPSKWRDEKVNCLQCHKTPQAQTGFDSGPRARPGVAEMQAGEREELTLWLRRKRS